MTAALGDIEAWIFDLDNTLYPASCNLFEQVDGRITAFIAERFGLPPDRARRMQKQYFRDFGTTLRGLMVEHDVDPESYLEYVHAIDITPVTPDPRLDGALARLAGRKFIFTNGSARHAANVTGRLGITGRFDDVFDIAAAGWLPKPDPRPYQTMIERFAIDPARACMVEDIARNLVPARALGMATVWVTSPMEWAQPGHGGVGGASHIDHVVEDLVGWLDGLSAGGGAG
jgi:putative hydrolase of the HAD superfamily